MPRSPHPDQYIFPFGAAQQELLAQINLLRDIETDLSPARQDRVVELLERLVLLGNDLSEHDGRVQVRAQVIAIAARIKTRSSYSDRSIRDWCRWAESLGLLTVAVRSHIYGRREWNQYTIHVDKIRQLCTIGMAGSGRKRPEVTAALGAEVPAAPGPEVTAAPYNSSNNRRNNSNREPQSLAAGDPHLAAHREPTALAAGVSEPAPPHTSRAPVVVVSFGSEIVDRLSPADSPSDASRPPSPPSSQSSIPDPQSSISDLQSEITSCGVARANEALRRAQQAGLSTDDIRQRIGTYRSLPTADQRPGTLYNWLAIPRSYDPTQLGRSAPTLTLAPGLDDAAQRRRAELIRYGRSCKWDHARLQRAITNFEREQLREPTALAAGLNSREPTALAAGLNSREPTALAAGLNSREPTALAAGVSKPRSDP